MNKVLKKSLKILFNMAIFFGIAVVIMFFIMANISGQNPQLRDGAEQFLSKATKSRAVIGELKYLGFVPDIRVEMEAINFQTPGDPTDISMTVGQIEFSLPFMHYILNKKTAEKITLTDLKARAGFITPKALEVNEITIVNDPMTGAYIGLTGQYGDSPYDGRIELVPLPLGEARTVYKLPKETPVQFSTDIFDFNAILSGHGHGSYLRDITLTHDDGTIVQGELTLTVEDEQTSFEGTFEINSEELNINMATSKDDEEVVHVNANLSTEVIDVKNLRAFESVLYDVTAFLLHDPENKRPFAIEGTLGIDLGSVNCAGEALSGFQANIEMNRPAHENFLLWENLPLSDLGLTETGPCATYLKDYQ